MAVPYIKRLVAGSSLRRPGFIRRAVHVVALRLLVFLVLQGFPVVIIPPMLHIHLFVLRPVRCCSTTDKPRCKNKKNHIGEGALPFPYSPQKINSTFIKCNVYITVKNNTFYYINNAYYTFRSIPPSTGMHEQCRAS